MLLTHIYEDEHIHTSLKKDENEKHFSLPSVNVTYVYFDMSSNRLFGTSALLKAMIVLPWSPILSLVSRCLMTSGKILLLLMYKRRATGKQGSEKW